MNNSFKSNKESFPELTINIAFISTAHIHSRDYLQTLTNVQGKNLVYGIWDDMPSRGEYFANKFATRYFPKLEPCIQSKDFDAFVICAENSKHALLLEKLIPLRKPILCEKPLVINTADIAKIKTLLNKYHTPLIVGYFLAYSKAISDIRQLLDKKTIGTITNVDFQFTHNGAYKHIFDDPKFAWFHDSKLSGGGAFMDLGTHGLQLFRLLFGDISKLSVVKKNLSGIYPSVEDYGHAICQFSSGIVGHIDVSWVGNHPL